MQHIHVWGAVVGAVTLAVWPLSDVRADFVPEEWQYAKTISVPVGSSDGTLTGVVLDSEVFAHARRDLGDLRVVDAEGREVPFVLRSERSVREVVQRPVTMYDLSYVPGSHTSLIVDFGGNVAHNELTLLTTSKNFRRTVSVVGSNDRKEWHMLVEGSDVYDYSLEFSARNTRIIYPESLYRFVKVEITDGDEEPLAIAGVSARRTEVTGAKRLSYTASLVRSEEDSTTVLTADLGQHGLETDSAVLDLRSVNVHRPVRIYASDDNERWTYVGNDVLYAYQTAKVRSSKTKITYGSLQKRYIRFVIENYDDQPLDVAPTVVFEGLAHSVLFLADAEGTYGLYYGSSTARMPRYDLQTVQKVFDEDEIVRGVLGAQEVSAWYAPPVVAAVPEPVVPWTERYASVLLAIMYVCAGSLLTFFMLHIVRRTRDMPTAQQDGLQE